MKYEGEPEWTVEKQNRKQGSTDYESCGWCQQASGTHRYDCCLHGRCHLFPDYDSHEVKWDTTCLFKNLGQKDIADFVDSKTRHISDLRSQITRTEIEIQVLKSLIVDDCPPLPSNRKCDHFSIGDEVWVWVLPSEKHVRHGWISATVIDGYRHHDGCVSFKADEPFHKGDYEYGCGGGGGYATPTIILGREYQWFKSHPDRFLPWMKLACSQKFNGEVIDPESVEVPK